MSTLEIYSRIEMQKLVQDHGVKKANIMEKIRNLQIASKYPVVENPRPRRQEQTQKQKADVLLKIAELETHI